MKSSVSNSKFKFNTEAEYTSSLKLVAEILPDVGSMLTKAGVLKSDERKIKDSYNML